MANCPDCGAHPKGPHVVGCDVERCAGCGGQAISCSCGYEEELAGLACLPWSGEWPGKAECREYGFWCVGPPWVAVPAGTAGATEDLNRLAVSCRWDQQEQKFKLPT